MRPLLLHSSRHCVEGNCEHRRTIHLELAPHFDLPDGYAWHDFVPLKRGNAVPPSHESCPMIA